MRQAVPDRTYLDHAATSPLRPEAEQAVREGLALWANPSSPHAEGRRARAAMEDARARIAKALGWDGEVILTSGASEAANIALSRAKAGARFVSQVEHEAVLRAAPAAARLAVKPDGSLDEDGLREAVEGSERVLVAVQQVNSETGNRQDLAAIGAIVHEAGGLLLADCAQGAGKIPVPPAADMAIVAAHKLGGPVGIGALLVRDYALLEPSGGQERGYRAGTENLPAALGFAAALEAAGDPYISPDALAPLTGFASAVRESGGTWYPDFLADPVDYILALAMPGMSGSAQLMRFDMAGIAVSQGSACSSGSLRQSHVLEAMGIDDDVAARTIRVSFGWNTRRADVERFCAAWTEMARGGR